ncbi:MAG: hypothetical protein J6I73_03965 [Treponema sp.]|nr:hypothetical protein [Treponema sp.]
MDNEKIKLMLLDVQDTKLDFTVIQSGKESRRVNGLYKPETHEIILHNKNFKSDNGIIYTAIHEYAHHLMTEEFINNFGDTALPNAKSHTQAFWAKFNELLIIAEKKKYYTLSIKSSPELEKLTEEIRTKYLAKNGELMQKFGRLLERAFELCEEADIRYEDYIDRVLCLPRTVAHDIRNVGMENINPALGYDNMKLVASLKNPGDRSAAEKQLLNGTSPVSVKAHMKRKKSDDADDKKTRLEKEKKRIERTIEQLQKRLEFVEVALGNL